MFNNLDTKLRRLAKIFTILGLLLGFALITFLIYQTVIGYTYDVTDYVTGRVIRSYSYWLAIPIVLLGMLFWYFLLLIPQGIGQLLANNHEKLSDSSENASTDNEKQPTACLGASTLNENTEDYIQYTEDETINNEAQNAEIEDSIDLGKQLKSSIKDKLLEVTNGKVSDLAITGFINNIYKVNLGQNILQVISNNGQKDFTLSIPIENVKDLVINKEIFMETIQQTLPKIGIIGLEVGLWQN